VLFAWLVAAKPATTKPNTASKTPMRGAPRRLGPLLI
jgi:hypothetical protein